jgi:hypothetical protein
VVVLKVRAAERRAHSEAAKADTVSAELADQLRVVKEKDAAKLEAEHAAAVAAANAQAAAKKADAADADADVSRSELQKANVKLQKTLAEAQAAVANEQAARQQVEKLLDLEKKRNRDLENQKKKISTELH